MAAIVFPMATPSFPGRVCGGGGGGLGGPFPCTGRAYDNVGDGSCDGVTREPAAAPLLIPNRCLLGEQSQ